MNKLFKYFTNCNDNTVSVEIGNTVSFRTQLTDFVGVVKSIRGDKALVVGMFLASEFSQWILVSKLTIVCQMV